MIKLPNIDGTIWNIESKSVDIVNEILARGELAIDLNGEGPCAQSLGLYDLLDFICSKFNISKKLVTISTCNQIEKHHEYNIRINTPLYVNETQHFFANTSLPVNKTLDSEFYHFGIFIGRSNWIRLWLASQVWKKYKNKTIMTYHWKSRDEFHAVHLGLDDMLRWNATLDEINQSCKFLEQCPLEFAEQNSYPILSPAHLNICKIYHRFFLEIVCETYFSGDSFYPTEKIWRPLIMKTPFVVHGSVDYLRNLRKLGFKTFNNWWSEEYDDYGHDNRVRKILNLIDNLQKLSLNDLESMYHDMLPTLEHNHHLFMNLKAENFKETFGYV